MARVANSNPNLKIPDGPDAVVTRITPSNASLMAPMHGRFYELARIGNLFSVSNAAATATSVALTATCTGLIISNPAGNNKDIVLEAFGFGTLLAYVALSSIGIQGGYSTAGVVTHTTPLVVTTNFRCLNLGAANLPTALVDSAATTVNPTLLMILGGTALAAAVSNGQFGIVDLGGGIRLQPGAWAATYTSTATSSISSFWWSEEPR